MPESIKRILAKMCSIEFLFPSLNPNRVLDGYSGSYGLRVQIPDLNVKHGLG